MIQQTKEKERVRIEFMYIDLGSCTRCQGTRENLREAAAVVSDILEGTGREVYVEEIHIETEEQARRLGLVSSPTIRINGRDIQQDFQETPCKPCGDICDDDIECRIWTFRGEEYTEAPKAMIIEAILEEVYGGSREEGAASNKHDIPDNLKRFFAAKNKEKNDDSAHSTDDNCCSPGDSASGKCC